jgi:hypothetical protein
MSTDSQRQAFEKWATEQGLSTDHVNPISYRSVKTDYACLGWQASNAQSQELIAELVSVLEKIASLGEKPLNGGWRDNARLMGKLAKESLKHQKGNI